MKTVNSRQPKRSKTTSFAREVFEHEGAKYIRWRLFRRSSVNARLAAKEVLFFADSPREVIAHGLVVARDRLRDFVDDYDLSLMGETP